MNVAQITGRDESFLIELTPPHRLHPQVADAFSRLQVRARSAGFDLQPVSCFRSFERQLAIWNAKANGSRAVLDADGKPLSREQFSDWQWVEAILRWSALPGASRHHWGTDLDVYDAAAVAPDYAVQLTPTEVNARGPFAPLHSWLDEQIAAGNSEGFFRPYARDKGGVAPERWHLSFAPLAAECERLLESEVLLKVLRECDTLALGSAVEAHWQEIFTRFVTPAVSACEQENRQ
ncbi:LAS superfamily LD-carboxypeptidase LdcB [Litorivivens lipolytica]|uniref:LAS superfamily LD-carboxypeptidase LdcB n=1 Tax=Litorivivens lipolytica TaxID=1524264 RepID=A0A7W4W5K1_9GAMM|nr:LAS superfamily LD-carboxypeptidase LdcB [Litorivivens lipolytica]